ncbi:uncharacterized protein BDV17DRAFT_252897 [Aspergillus undulatus]|uniref:uncharacterized protein n=1 Tax=Aspergillus undulatus TaxID=1810928 RepID=UPI003CCDD779
MLWIKKELPLFILLYKKIGVQLLLYYTIVVQAERQRNLKLERLCSFTPYHQETRELLSGFSLGELPRMSKTMMARRPYTSLPPALLMMCN